jgi:outer membrane protein insertion porin family
MRVFGLFGLILWMGCLFAQTPVRSVQLQGVSVAPPEQVGAALYALVGTAPTEEQIRDALQQVESWYRQRGYTLARVADYTLDESGVLRVQVAEGVIEQITVQGNKRTRSEVLRRLLGVRPGEVYNEERLQRVRQRIGRFPFLRDAKLGAEPGEQVGTANLLLQIEEEQSRRATAASRVLLATPSWQRRMSGDWGIACVCSGSASRCATRSQANMRRCDRLIR